MWDFIETWKSGFLLLSLILAIFILVIQHCTNIATEKKAEAEKIVLNKKINNLDKQNKELIAGKNMLIKQNRDLSDKIDKNQVELQEKQKRIEELKQRPWVDVGFEIMTPLSYDNQGWDAGVRWHITIKYRLENIGKTPATNASFFATMIPLAIPRMDIDKKFDEIYSFQEKMIRNNMDFGQVLFPGKSRSVRFSLNANPQVFDEIKKNPNNYTGHFLIAVCATYGSTYNDELFHTAKAFEIFKRSGNQFISLAGESISIDDLAVVSYPIQGSRAK